MISLNPQFASLFVVVTASVVGAAPSPRSGQDRRYVVDVDVPGVIDVHMRSRTVAASSRILGRRHDHSQKLSARTDSKAVYIQPPPSTASPGGSARRGLDDPIDQPDPNEEAHTESNGVSLVNYVARSYDDDSLGKRAMFRVDSPSSAGLIITHSGDHGTQQLSRSLAVRELDRRGLLDPLMPILGSIPGVGGIIQLVGGTLSDILAGLPILGPILGGLLLSPHPSASAQSAGNDTAAGQFFLDASSSQNASTIYVVDSGHPTSFAIASQFNATNMTSEHIVSLQMAFVNATSGQVQAYCATFDSDTSGQSALAAKPCITDGMTTVPHATQSFGWNKVNKAIRPLWNDNTGSKKRDYVVQAGASEASVSDQDVSKKQDSKSVVLLFEPFEAPASSNGTDTTTPAPANKDMTGAEAAADESSDQTSPDSDDEDEGEDDEDDSVPVFVAGVGSS